MTETPTTPPADPPRRRYTLSPAALEQRREAAQLSTGPRTDDGKAASSRNAWKHGASSAAHRQHFEHGMASLLPQLFGRPCKTTCPIHPDNPARTEAPCSLVTRGLTRAGGDCLDKAVYVDAFDAIIQALQGETDGVDALLASEIAAHVQMLSDMRAQIAHDRYTVIEPVVLPGGGVLREDDGTLVARRVLAHPLLPYVWKALEILGISFDTLNVTPKARERTKGEGEQAGAMQTMLGALMQRLAPSRRLPETYDADQEPDDA